MSVLRVACVLVLERINPSVVVVFHVEVSQILCVLLFVVLIYFLLHMVSFSIFDWFFYLVPVSVGFLSDFHFFC